MGSSISNQRAASPTSLSISKPLAAGTEGSIGNRNFKPEDGPQQRVPANAVTGAAMQPAPQLSDATELLRGAATSLDRATTGLAAKHGLGNHLMEAADQLDKAMTVLESMPKELFQTDLTAQLKLSHMQKLLREGDTIASKDPSNAHLQDAFTGLKDRFTSVLVSSRTEEQWAATQASTFGTRDALDGRR